MLRRFRYAGDKYKNSMNFYKRNQEITNQKEDERRAQKGVASPSQPDFYRLPPLTPTTTPHHTPSIRSNAISAPSSPFFISPPMSPLRQSSTVQFSCFDDVISTPSLERIANNAAQKEKAKKKKMDNADQISSISQWLMNLKNDDFLPKFDFNSTVLEQYPEQISLDCIRECAHKSIFPRPLFSVRKENLDELCAERMKRNIDNIDNSSTDEFPDKLSSGNHKENEITEQSLQSSNEEETNSSTETFYSEESESKGMDKSSDRSDPYAQSSTFSDSLVGYSSASVCACPEMFSSHFQFMQRTASATEATNGTNEHFYPEITRKAEYEEFRKEFHYDKNQSSFNIRSSQHVDLSLSKENTINQVRYDNVEEIISVFEQQLMLVNDFNALKDKICGATISNVTIVQLEEQSEKEDPDNYKKQEKNIKELKKICVKRKKRGRPKKSRTVKFIEGTLKKYQKTDETEKKRVYKQRRSSSDIYTASKLSTISTRRQSEKENQEKEGTENKQCPDSGRNFQINEELQNISFIDIRKVLHGEKVSVKGSKGKKKKLSVNEMDRKQTAEDKEIMLIDNDKEENESSQENCGSIASSDLAISKAKGRKQKKQRSFLKKKEKKKRRTVFDTAETKSALLHKLNMSRKKPYTFIEQITTDEAFRVRKTRKELYGYEQDEEFRPLDLISTGSSTPAMDSPRFVYDTPNRLSNALRTYSAETLQTYIKRGTPTYGETSKSHKWVRGMFCLFCEKFHFPTWPLEEDPTYGFLKLLGIGLRYSVKSLCASIIP
eukprot:MONOS_13295.1-p1 / transcript=MONOS_13295.1 / gene=MONOS_13295 / organism=Monocercomonoides_exilis_PA203 / gene_product=unspecified product / transcript_product=unspecified product / location=Mono_scaffold00805:108-2546(-) / protein_length=777 / sequence_SO=supercontig / SO=protein_coding / is_pseudo=false